VVVWQPGSFARRTFGAPGPCPQTSTGRAVSAVATTGDRVVWLAYAGGNTRDWTLWTATSTARAAHRLRFATADVDAPAPIVLGNGGDGGVPYAVGSTVVVLAPAGDRKLTWQAPGRVVALAEGANSVGALVAGGHLLVRSLSSANVVDLGYAPGDVKAFRVASVGAIVQTRNGIEIRRPNRTAPLHVRSGARLVGFADGQLVYATGRELREFYRPTGKDSLLRRVPRPFVADFDRRGMAWATGRRVCWATRAFVGAVANPRSC
jgi:hypothetical protein